MKKLLAILHNDLYVEVICLSFFVIAFCYMPFENFIDGYVKILTNSAVLLQDFVYIGGMGAACFNVGTVLLLNIIIIKLMKMKISSPLFAGLLISAGFAFFGKTVINVLPIYFGIYLFSKLKHVRFQSFIITLLFSSGLAPLVSYVAVSSGLELYFSIPLAILCGILAGFIIPAFAAHTMQFHDGYNLFNTGFAIGIIAALFNGVLSIFNIKIESARAYDNTNYVILYAYLYISAFIFILIAILKDRNVFKNYKRLNKTTGRLISYYIRDFSIEAVMLNYGILCICLTSFFVVFNIPMNGIICGSILSVAGCASFGVHIRNIWPIWVGAIIAITLKGLINKELVVSFENGLNVSWDFTIDNNLSTMVAFIFAGSLAPISGKFGIAYGILGGFIHMGFTPYALGLHKGLDLYNNGFAAGFEAAVIHILAEKILHRESNHHARKS